MRELADRPSVDVPVDRLPLFLRGYVVRDAKAKAKEFEAEPKVGPSDEGWTLTFDCETTTDEAQALRFGAYQLRKGDTLKEEGLFHAEGMADDGPDMAVLREVQKARGLKLRNVRHFVDYVFFDKIYQLGGTIIGFNLPFDISRIAVHHGSAQKSMRGGFSFKLSRNTDWPRVRVRHISQRMAFIRYGAPPKKRTPAGQANKGLSVPPRRGYFVDVKTMAAALLSESFNLARLTETLKTEHQKAESDEHGGPLTAEYVAYGLNDVQATWECHQKLAARLVSYRLSTIEAHMLYSEASLGKAYLRVMNVQPWTKAQPDFPPELIGQIVSTYYGGRAEVRIRRRPTRVLYCDFLSMYPTVCTLMGLWRFVIAKQTRWCDATKQTQAFLDRVDPKDLYDQKAWSQLTTLVQLCPDDDVLPVRARYGGESSSNIGVNRLTSSAALWFTLADVVTSKVLTGKTPRILSAIRFAPGETQEGLQPVDIAGRPEFRVDPNGNEDFYRRVIDLRQTVKAKRDAAPPTDKAALEAEQLALKILANATSYGIFIELIVKDLDKAETMTAYGPDGIGYATTSKKYEEPGAYFHPLLATLITGAARLMLALAERRAADEGLDWVFCDTDSLAIARPDGMPDNEFVERARRVCSSFNGLNPYETKGSILQVEEVNFTEDQKDDWTKTPELYCYAISAKRYVLYNRNCDGMPVVRKASAHGLGHLLPPYIDPDRKRRSARLSQIKVDLWQEDLWKRIIETAEHGDNVVTHLEQDERFSAPAASRWAATKPTQARWFSAFNRGLDYERKVRPVGFLLSFKALKPEQIAAADPDAWLWWSTHKRRPAPVAPFNRDPRLAAQHAFDRKSRKAVPDGWLMTYSRSLADYHIHPEHKFWCAEAGGQTRRFSGVLKRRHVIAGPARLIGKEADQWEEQRYVGPDDGSDILYDLSPTSRRDMIAAIKLARERFSIRTMTKAAGVSDHTLAAIVSDRKLVADIVLVRVSEAVGRLWVGLEMHTAEEAELVEWAREQAAVAGSTKFGARIGCDPSNLMAALRGRRGVSPALLTSLRTAYHEDRQGV